MLTVKNATEDGMLTLQQIMVKDECQNSPLSTTQLAVKYAAEDGTPTLH